jgi:putative transposase
MPRKPLIRSQNLPYHVTSRSNNKEWFTIPLPEMWKLTQKCLNEATTIHPVEVISFVLMNNHYHMLLLTPKGNLDSFMYEFNKRMALAIKLETGQINKIFGGRYKWCLIQSQHYFINCYKYIYQNPVRAGLVLNCEDYPFSTLRSIIKNINFSIPIFDKYGFKDEYGLRWINQKIDSEEEKALKKRLSRSVLSDSVDKRRKEIGSKTTSRPTCT